MSGSKWYSPQLSRELVSRLYRQARTEQIPMTKLANRIIEQALDSTKSPEVIVAPDRSPLFASSPLKAHPDFDPFRDDPSFEQIVASLAPKWTKQKPPADFSAGGASQSKLLA